MKILACTPGPIFFNFHRICGNIWPNNRFRIDTPSLVNPGSAAVAQGAYRNSAGVCIDMCVELWNIMQIRMFQWLHLDVYVVVYTVLIHRRR